MKAFKFKLDSLLVLREARKRKALEIFGLAVQRVKVLEGEATNLELSIHACNRNADILRQTGSTVFEQVNFINQVESLKYELKLKQKELKDAQEVEKNALQNLKKAKQEEDIVLNLKDKKRNEHRKTFLQEEEKMLEDLVNGRRKGAIFKK